MNAFNKRYQIIHKGTVLFYSKGDDGYFVQFHVEELGCEFCPDSEVSRVSQRRLPFSAKKTASMNETKATQTLAPVSLDEVGSISARDSAYERRSLVSLVANVERAIERKNAILDAMEEQNRLVSPYRRSRHRHFDPISLDAGETMQQTISAWLHANLILTNRSLRKALEHLQSTYAESSTLAESSSSGEG